MRALRIDKKIGSAMSFGDLHAFYFLFLALGVFLLYLFSERRKKKALQTFAQGELSALLTVSTDKRRRKIKIVLILAAFVLSTLALMRPQAGFRWEEGRRYGLDILVAVDTSRSMLTEDVKPNRLERAKAEVANLVKRLKGDRIGLLGFSGDAILLCPLTIDYNGFMLALNSLDTDATPTGGTSISNAISQALKSLGEGEKKRKVLLLLTDGEDHEGNTVTAVDKAKKGGLRIFSVGIGTEGGDLIPVGDPDGRRSFLRDRKGQVVKSHLHSGTLERISLSTGGTYIRGGGEEALVSLYDERLSKLEKEQFEGPMKRRHKEWFQVPLAIALVLLIFESLPTKSRIFTKGTKGHEDNGVRF
jgi:Ca-activated chloride channel family protein